MNYLHVKGIFLRRFFMLMRSWPRLVDIFFWSAVSITIWGFVTLWLRGEITEPEPKVNFVILLLGALIFWEIFTRVQQSIAVGFLEDVWTRNVINVFVAPVSAKEFIAGLAVVALFNTALASLFMVVFAWLLYALEIWTFGFYLIPFLVNLILFGFSLGLISLSLIMRFGPSVEVIAWALPFLFQPISAVFYPVSVLPVFLQKVALFLPTTHLFEGMREVLLQNVLPLDHIVWASALNVLYVWLALIFFAWILGVVRRRGALGRFVTD